MQIQAACLGGIKALSHNVFTACVNGLPVRHARVTAPAVHTSVHWKIGNIPGAKLFRNRIFLKGERVSNGPEVTFQMLGR
jgi:hypothetical protein